MQKTIKDYDWKKIQEIYDSGISTRNLRNYVDCPKSWNTFYKAVSLGLFKFKTQSEAIKNHNKIHGPRKQTQETKDKLSKIRIAFLAEHPEKVPYKLNHYSKGPSYPEQYFAEVFRNEGISLESQKQVGMYCLDFYNDSKMLAVEIDGEQHYVDSRVVESDIRRTKYLESLGWKIFRIRWSLWQKMYLDQKKQIIQEIRRLLD